MTFDEQTVREWREVYLVSNTPLYLYKRLRGLPAVQQLAQATGVKELKAEYLRRAGSGRHKPDDVATAYACLIAITHKDPDEAVPILRSLDTGGLDWAAVLRDLYFVKSPAGRAYRVTVPAPSSTTPKFATDATATFVSTVVPRPGPEGKANL
jgi:hypothetical protein